MLALVFRMTRSTRLFEIIQLLRRARAPLTAQQIGEELEVTKRTIYRDMAALQAMRLPIEGEAGIGYVMRGGFDLPPLMFSRDEVEAIVVGLALVGRAGDPGLERSAARVASKIADVLPDGAERIAPLHVSRWNKIPKSAVAPGALRQFIREAAELSITYLDLTECRTVRVHRSRQGADRRGHAAAARRRLRPVRPGTAERPARAAGTVRVQHDRSGAVANTPRGTPRLQPGPAGRPMSSSDLQARPNDAVRFGRRIEERCPERDDEGHGKLQRIRPGFIQAHIATPARTTTPGRSRA